jgi:hypothetical protein
MAAFENKSISEIKNLLIDSIQTKFNNRLRLLPKSFIRVIATVFAGVYIILYKQIGWLFLQLFPETAHWGEVSILGKRVRPLIMSGRLIGVGDPKTGTQWRGFISVAVTTRYGALVAGTQMKSDITGKLYLTEESATLDSDTVLVPIVCAENGTAGNLDAGDILSFVDPLGTVKKTAAVSAVIAYAANDETEMAYRSRVVSRFRNPPLGGALADYRKWASDAAGVLQAYPYKDSATPSGVLIYISGSPSLFPNRVPSSDLLRQVGDVCTYDPETGRADRKPITAVIDPAGDGTYANILPVSIISFDVYVSGLTGIPISDFAEALKPALENYFLGREPYIRGLSDDNNKTNIVSKNNVSTVVDQTAISVKAEFSSAAMHKDSIAIPSYTLGAGELAKLGNLYINGGIV